MLRKTMRFLLIPACVCAALLFAYGDGPTFRAEYVFKGTSLAAGWKTLGQAEWKVRSG